MIETFSSRPRRQGTRFRLFPEAPYATATPGEGETVWLSPPAGSIGPGPQDGRMHVIDPIGKTQHYGIGQISRWAPLPYLPPWEGPTRAPALPDRAGNFDYLDPATRQFEMAHLYGVVRFTLDVWERYFAGPIPWHFRPPYERLEMSILRTVDNAFAGFGFLEVGAQITDTGEYRPFSLNFDVVAHEVGHLIIYSKVGVPVPELMDDEYYGFHEAAADLAALVATMHFDAVLDHLLETTHGNLYTFNELNRFAELSPYTQIRIASNDRKLSDFAAGWTDEHALSEPLTGAIFDILVDVFDENLRGRGLISPEVENLLDQFERFPEYEEVIQSLFDEAYQGRRHGFRAALVQARDYLGVALAETWTRLPPDRLHYAHVGEILLEVDRELSGGRFRQAILNSLLWREIGLARVGPRLSPPGPESHALSPRTLLPSAAPRRRGLSYRERRMLARPRRL
jgi:hypothetical protein